MEQPYDTNIKSIREVLPPLVKASEKIHEGLSVWRDYFPTVDDATILRFAQMVDAAIHPTHLPGGPVLQVGEAVVTRKRGDQRTGSMRQDRTAVVADVREVVGGDIFTAEQLVKRLTAAGKTVRTVDYYRNFLGNDKGANFERVRMGEYRVKGPVKAKPAKASKPDHDTLLKATAQILLKYRSIDFTTVEIAAKLGLADGRQLTGVLSGLRTGKAIKRIAKGHWKILKRDVLKQLAVHGG